MFKYIFISFFTLFAGVSSLTCDQVRVHPDLQIEEILELWEVVHFYQDPEYPMSCTTMYLENVQDNEYLMRINYIQNDEITNEIVSFKPLDDPARWILDQGLAGYMLVLSTDYENVAMLGHCIQMEDGNAGFYSVFMMSRNQTQFTDQHYDVYRDFLEFYYGIPQDIPFDKINHENCLLKF